MQEAVRALLVIAHGSVVPGAEREVWALADRLREKSELDVVEVGYLDYTEPSIPEAVAACVERGATEIVVLPYFLAEGYLVRKVRLALTAAMANHPGVRLREARALGPDPRFAEIVMDRIREAAKDD